MVKRYSKFLSSTTIIVIYLLAFGSIYFVYPNLDFTSTLINVFIADSIATIIVFIFSLLFKNSSIYDPFWSVIPPIIVIHFMFLFPEGNFIRQMIVLGLVTFWGIRLTLNWHRSWPGIKHQDWRYSHIAEKAGKFYWPVSFLGIHYMPTVFVFLACLPLWYIISSKTPLNFFDIIAALFTFIAILVEWIADEQLFRFKKQNNNTTFIRSGLWSISRHPNYFGEISFWLGLFLFLFSISKQETNVYWTLIGPVSMIILFTFISIPMMEKRNIQKKPGYKEYIKKVPAMFPFRFGKK